MGAIPRIIPISELRQDAAAIVKCAQETREPIIITQRGRAAAVLMSVEEYEREIERARIIERLHQAEADIAAGDPGYSWEEVDARLDEIIKKYE